MSQASGLLPIEVQDCEVRFNENEVCYFTEVLCRPVQSRRRSRALLAIAIAAMLARPHVTSWSQVDLRFSSLRIVVP